MVATICGLAMKLIACPDGSKKSQGFSEKGIKSQNCSDTEKWRSSSTLQSQLYQEGLGHLIHKKKFCSGAKAPETRPTPSAPVVKSTIDRTRLALELSRITGTSLFNVAAYRKRSGQLAILVYIYIYICI